MTINDKLFNKGEFVQFNSNEGEIEFKNTTDSGIDIFLFGGEEYTEAIVSEGPFVMNSFAEIAGAYRDFHAGKYGEINSRDLFFEEKQ